uniref:Uncharacterized protein n=1 Tax=Parascaris univalens TaxID=6257 RepID=A0A914ZUU5_PARUN
MHFNSTLQVTMLLLCSVSLLAASCIAAPRHANSILDCVMINNPRVDCYGARFVPTDGMFVRFSFIYAVLTPGNNAWNMSTAMITANPWRGVGLVPCSDGQMKDATVILSSKSV